MRQYAVICFDLHRENYGVLVGCAGFEMSLCEESRDVNNYEFLSRLLNVRGYLLSCVFHVYFCVSCFKIIPMLKDHHAYF